MDIEPVRLCVSRDLWSTRFTDYSIDSRLKTCFAVTALDYMAAVRDDVAGCILRAGPIKQGRNATTKQTT